MRFWMILFLMFCGVAQAAGLGMNLSSGKEPLAIDAQDGIEWRRKEQLYVAQGDVKAVKGDLTVEADELRALYREENGKQPEIYRLEAHGNVVLTSPTEKVTGDAATYDLDQAVFVVTGNDLKLSTATDLITARDSLEYWETKQIAVARGDAVVTNKDGQLQADLISAYFVQQNGDMTVTQMDAVGNVAVITPGEVVRGDKGRYFVDQKMVTVAGNVRVTRGQNQLNGAFAEVDLANQVSRLLSTPDGSVNRRVTGLFSPGKPILAKKSGQGAEN